MDIQRAIEQYSPLSSLLNTAEIDAEIREELEFHIEMRTRDNLQAGMSLEEASHAAQQRFGDFEASRRACRKIALGPRILFQRLQTLLLLTLLVTVVYQAMLLFQLQSSSRDEIESLMQLVEELRSGSERTDEEKLDIASQRVERDQRDHISAEVKIVEFVDPRGLGRWQ